MHCFRTKSASLLVSCLTPCYKQQSFLVCKSFISFVTSWFTAACVGAGEVMHYWVNSLHSQCNFTDLVAFMSPSPSCGQQCSRGVTVSLGRCGFWNSSWNMLIEATSLHLLLQFSGGTLYNPVIQCPFDTSPSSSFQRPSF